MAKSNRAKKQSVSPAEKEQVRARKLVGNTFGVALDQFGRERLVSGTAEAVRQLEIASAGKVVRIRDVDPLQVIERLSDRQRKAGARYRGDYQYSAREGLKGASYEPGVDGGRQSAGVAYRLIQSHQALADARDAIVYAEIVAVLDAVCGEAMTLSEVSRIEGVVRDIPTQLLVMGLERLAVYYSTVPEPKQFDR